MRSTLLDLKSSLDAGLLHNVIGAIERGERKSARVDISKIAKALRSPLAQNLERGIIDTDPGTDGMMVGYPTGGESANLSGKKLKNMEEINPYFNLPASCQEKTLLY